MWICHTIFQLTSTTWDSNDALCLAGYQQCWRYDPVAVSAPLQQHCKLSLTVEHLTAAKGSGKGAS